MPPTVRLALMSSDTGMTAEMWRIQLKKQMHVCDVHSHYHAYLFPAILDRNDFQEYFCHPLYQLTQCPDKNYKTR